MILQCISGVGGENRTPVHNAFATKELQQFFKTLIAKFGDYKINKNTTATTTTPMAKLKS